MSYTILTEPNYLTTGSNIFIPVGTDNVQESQMFLKASEVYPELPSAYSNLYGTTEILPGKVYPVTIGDKVLILATIKAIDKYGATVINVLDCYHDLVTKMSSLNINSFTIPVLDYNYTKLLDSVGVPVTIDYLSMFSVPITIVDTNDVLKYYMTNHDDNNDLFTWKADSAKNNKFVLEEDFILIGALNRTLLTKEVTLSKGKLVKVFELCKNEFGMFQEIEFFSTEYGKFFKEFNWKFFTIVNNGILIQKNRSGLVIGPGMSYYMLANASRVFENNKKIHAIAGKLGVKFKDKPNKFQGGGKPSSQQQTPVVNEPLF